MIVRDTHALIWWVKGDAQLSAPAKTAIEGAQQAGRALVSAISIWEIAMLMERGRIALAMDLDQWLAAVKRLKGVEIFPVFAQFAMQSVNLPGDFHKDPADRMIVALARELNAAVVTADQKIQRYAPVRWVW